MDQLKTIFRALGTPTEEEWPVRLFLPFPTVPQFFFFLYIYLYYFFVHSRSNYHHPAFSFSFLVAFFFKNLIVPFLTLTNFFPRLASHLQRHRAIQNYQITFLSVSSQGRRCATFSQQQVGTP
jgi:hypothetical protein